MPTLKSVIHEIHRRSLWQVLAVYLAGSFGALQAVDILATNVGLPDWVSPFAVVLLLIGLPIVLATAFVQEGPLTAAPSPEPQRSLLVLPHSVQDAAPRERPAPHRVFTWRRAIFGGIAAFSTLGFSTAGFVAMREMGFGPMGSLRAKGVLADRAPVVVAEFGSAAGDTLLARAATEAFRVDLAQSPAITVMEPRQLAQVLRRMQRQPDAPLDVTLAAEVAAREGAAAVVAGEVNPVGRGFLLTVRLVGAHDGAELASLRETARDTADVIAAIDRLSKRLRERIGESYRSLRRGQPLASVTTSSLEALRKYSQGARALDMAGEEARGIELLQEATTLDTAFAMAYRKLGVALSNRFFDRARAVDALMRAYRHRDRLPPRERYLTEASYLTSVTWQPERAISAYHSLLELDSLDAYALNNLGVVHSRSGDFARANEYYLRSARADPDNALAFTNSLYTSVAIGKREQAEANLVRFRERFPANQRYHEFAGLLAATRGDYAAAERSLQTLLDSASNGVARIRAYEILSDLEATRGRLTAAEKYMQAAIAEDESQNRAGASLLRSIDLAMVDVHVRRNAAAGIVRVEDALRRRPLSSLQPLDRPYHTLAWLYAAAGKSDRARAYLSEYDVEVPQELRTWIDRALYQVARAEVAKAQGNHAEAITLINGASAVADCPRCALVLRGYAQDAMGQADSALVTLEQYVNRPSLNALTLLDRWYLAGVLERIAELYEQRGELQKAADYYNRLITLWKDADAELQPRVQAAQRRLQQIVARRG